MYLTARECHTRDLLCMRYICNIVCALDVEDTYHVITVGESHEIRRLNKCKDSKSLRERAVIRRKR